MNGFHRILSVIRPWLTIELNGTSFPPLEVFPYLLTKTLENNFSCEIFQCIFKNGDKNLIETGITIFPIFSIKIPQEVFKKSLQQHKNEAL